MRNIIFDFGNVLVEWHPEQIYTEYFGDEAKAWWFLRHVADNEWRGRVDAGESTMELTAELVGRFPEYKEAIELFNQRYFDMLTGEVPGMRDLLTGLLSYSSPTAERRAPSPVSGEEPRYQIYGLTNWSMETFPEARRRFGILQMIDRYVVSAQERLIKPDPRLFKVLLDRYGLKAEECTFVDDNPDNVAAARKMGMKGIVFTGADALRKELL